MQKSQTEAPFKRARFVSFVGSQVPAVLNPLLVLQHSGISFTDIHLIATPFVRAGARGIRDYCRDWHQITTIHEIDVPESLDCKNSVDIGNSDSIPGLLQRLCTHSEPVVFNLNGGMNFQVAIGVLHVPLSATWFVYSHNEGLTLFQAGSEPRVRTYTLPLVTDTLDVLRLQNIAFSRSFEVDFEQSPQGPSQDTLTIGKVRFDAVVNRHNTLHFYLFLCQPFLMPDEMKADPLLKRIRALITLATGRSRFAQLYHREITVITTRSFVKERIESDGRGKLRVEQWTPAKCRQVFYNRRAWLQSMEQPAASESAIDSHGFPVECLGSLKREGKTLMCFLGLDILPTLIAICSHRPDNLYLMYDRTSAPVARMAECWKKEWKRLQVGFVAFVPTRFDSLRLLETNIQAKCLEVNATPGTKLQGALLILLGRVAASGVSSFWTINNQRGLLTDLQGQLPGKILEGPSPLDLLVLRGETIDVKGDDRLALDRLSQKLDGITRWFQLVQAQQRSLTRFVAGMNQSVPGASCVADQWNVTLRFDGKQGSISFKHHHDLWFEQWVGWRFLKVGGADDVRIRMRTKWSTDHQRGALSRPAAGAEKTLAASEEHGERLYEPFKSDFDVVLRFGHRYMVISCKSGKVKETTLLAEEVAAVSAIFGRFTIPVLVQLPWDGEPTRIKETWRLGGTHLLDDKILRTLIRTMFDSHSTTTGH